MNLLYGSEEAKETLKHHRILHSFFNRFAAEWSAKRMSIDPSKITLYHTIIDHLARDQPPTFWYWLLKCFLFCYENRLADAIAAADQAHTLAPLHPSVLWVYSVLLLAQRRDLSFVEHVKCSQPHDQWGALVARRIL